MNAEPYCCREQVVNNAQFSGTPILAGIEEVASRIGIRMASELSGRLSGDMHAEEGAGGRMSTALSTAEVPEFQ